MKTLTLTTVFSYLFVCVCQTCGNIFSVQCDMSQGNALAPPRSCPARGGTVTGQLQRCKSSKFEEHGAHCYSDYQEIKVSIQLNILFSLYCFA
jgi:hypothetical protein